MAIGGTWTVKTQNDETLYYLLSGSITPVSSTSANNLTAVYFKLVQNTNNEIEIYSKTGAPTATWTYRAKIVYSDGTPIPADMVESAQWIETGYEDYPIDVALNNESTGLSSVADATLIIIMNNVSTTNIKKNLVHWWPLNGDTEDYGLGESNLTIDAQFDNNGKIGKALHVQTKASNYVMLNELSGKKEMTIAYWMKYDPSVEYTTWADVFSFITYNSAINDEAPLRMEFHGGYHSVFNNYHFGDSIGNTISLQENTWQHIIVTLDGEYVRTYLNGVLVGTPKAMQNTNTTSLTGEFRLGDTLPIGFWINDIRIYDYCLSQLEVSELSKGLVLHYDFEDPYAEGTTNLSGLIGYEMKIGGTQYNQAFIPAKWGEADGNITNYPDGGYNNMPYSKWTKTSGQDGGGFYSWLNRGFTLIEGHTYTASVYVKSNKVAETNGYICSVNSAALNNYYIVGPGFTLTTDWQRLSYTFTVESGKGSNEYCYSPLIYSNPDSGTWEVDICGFQIEENDHMTPFTSSSRNENIIYDCSGYGNHAVITGNVSVKKIGNIGEYAVSFPANSASNYIRRDHLDFLKQNITQSVWFYCLGTALSGSAYQFICGQGRDCGNSGMSIYLNSAGTNVQIALTTADNPHSALNLGNISSGWHNVVTTYNGTTWCGYLDGELTVSAARTGDIDYLQDNDSYVIGKMAHAYTNEGSYFPFYGYVSDLKIYATALSAEQVKTEYQRAVAMDKDGNLITGKLVENTLNKLPKITKSKTIMANGFEEYKEKNNTKLYKNGFVKANNFIEN